MGQGKAKSKGLGSLPFASVVIITVLGTKGFHPAPLLLLCEFAARGSCCRFALLGGGHLVITVLAFIAFIRVPAGK